MTISHPMYAIDHSGTLDLPHDRMDAVGDRKYKNVRLRRVVSTGNISHFYPQ